MKKWSERLSKAFQPGMIRSRLRTGFVLMAFLPAIAIILGSSLASYYNSRSQSLDRLESIAALKQFEITAWMTTLQNQLAAAINEQYSSERASVLLQIHAENWSSQVYSQAMRNRLARFLERNPQFSELSLVDPTGKIVLSTQAAHEGSVYAELSATGESRDGPFFRFTHSPWRAGQMIFIAAIPVHDANGDFLGVIAGLANLDPIRGILASRTGLGNTGVSYLVDEEHHALDLSSDGSALSNTSSPLHSYAIDQAVGQSKNGSGVYPNTQGIQVIGAYRWIPEIHLALLNEQHMVETVQSIVTTLEVTALITLAAVGLAILVSLRITRSIATPIEELAQTANQITQGKLNRLARVNREDEIGSLALAFNSMTAQLRDLISGLEARVEERTHALEERTAALQRKAVQLETSAQVSREVTSILNINELLHRVVELIQEAFRYSHAQIYLLDPEKQTLILSASSGQTSTEVSCLELIGTSLNGEAARMNQAVVINDVAKDQRFLADPFHPDTRSELVIPLRIGDQVIGTLDVQSAQAAAFYPEDLLVIQSLADQISIAIENARLYDQSQHLAVLEERNRLARELHDSVTQSLYSLSLLIEAWQRMSLAGRPVPVADFLAQFAEITQQSLKEMRLLVYELRPPALEKDGLVGALRQRLDAVEKRAGIETQLMAEDLVELPVTMEEEIYWIAQEALNNALKHSNATQLTIHLSAKDGQVIISIRDNGQGFDCEAIKESGGMGLRNMAERAEHIGGQLTIQSAPGQGTSVMIQVSMDAIRFGSVPFRSSRSRKTRP